MANGEMVANRPNRVSGGQPAGMRFGDEATIDNRGNKLWSCRRSAATSQSAMDPILSLTSNPDHLISDDENPTEELPRSTALAFCPISQVRNVHFRTGMLSPGHSREGEQSCRQVGFHLVSTSLEQ